MISISVVSIIIWVIVGLINLISCINHFECTWGNYWLVYGVLIVALINQIVEKLA